MNATNLTRIPRDYLIGAAKCGTTAIAEVLAQHPRVYLPGEKEVGFFSNDAQYGKGRKWYESRFAGALDGQTMLDASTQYLFCPDSARRMLETAGAEHIRSLTVVLRHPVDRAYSSYWQALRLGWIPSGTSFEQALKMEPELLQRQETVIGGRTVGAFIAAGRYASQIEIWRNVFGASKLQVYLHDELKNTPRVVYEDILSRMGLEWSEAMDVSHQANLASLPRNEILNAVVRSRNPLMQHLRVLIPRGARAALKKNIDRINQKPVRYAPMLPETRRKLLSIFEPEIDRLEKLLGRNLSDWRR